MSWTKQLTRLGAVALGLSASAAMAGTIVVRASGPSAGQYPPGKAITASSLNLKAGDTVVLLDARGTKTLTGPGVRMVAGTAGAAPSALGALLRSTGARQVRTGAVRGTGTTGAKPPTLWAIDASRGGATCLPNLANVVLWRPDMTGTASYQLTDIQSGQRADVAFASGQSSRAWPTTLPLRAGGRYRVAGGGTTTDLVIEQVAAADATADTVGGALIAKGCQRQLDQLVEAGASPVAG